MINMLFTLFSNKQIEMLNVMVVNFRTVVFFSLFILCKCERRNSIGLLFNSHWILIWLPNSWNKNVQCELIEYLGIFRAFSVNWNWHFALFTKTDFFFIDFKIFLVYFQYFYTMLIFKSNYCKYTLNYNLELIRKKAALVLVPLIKRAICRLRRSFP